MNLPVSFSSSSSPSSWILIAYARADTCDWDLFVVTFTTFPPNLSFSTRFCTFSKCRNTIYKLFSGFLSNHLTMFYFMSLITTLKISSRNFPILNPMGFSTFITRLNRSFIWTSYIYLGGSSRYYIILFFLFINK